MIQYTSEFGGELWLHPEWRSGQRLVFLTCVRCISLSWPFFFSRMTCLIWSHSQLNVPSGNISTFLRLKSIAIIFLRPWCAHPHARTHTHTQGHARGSASLCFNCHLIWLPFVWIFVLWAIGFKCALHFETGGWICRSSMRAAYPSRILAARSDSLIVSLPILLICGSFFFLALWLSLRIHTPTWYCGRIREPTRTCIVLHFSSLLLQVEAVWWPTLCSEAQQRVDAASSKHACEHTRTKHTGLHSHTLFFFSSLSHTCKHARLRRAVIDSGSVEPR